MVTGTDCYEKANERRIYDKYGITDLLVCPDYENRIYAIHLRDTIAHPWVVRFKYGNNKGVFLIEPFLKKIKTGLWPFYSTEVVVDIDAMNETVEIKLKEMVKMWDQEN